MQFAELGAGAVQVFSIAASIIPGVSLSSALGSLPLAAGPSVDFDLTVMVQAFLFLALAMVLKPLLFDPLLRVFEERELRTDGARAEARELEERAGELLQRYQREHERVSRAASEERERIRSETSKLEAQILSEARDRATRLVDDGRLAIAGEVTALRQDLEQQSAKLAKEVARAVLGREDR
jgi:F-type H+-transporting ATPase subunit b